MKISNLREIGEIRILNFFVKKFVKLKWDLHCLARMYTNFHNFCFVFLWLKMLYEENLIKMMM